MFAKSGKRSPTNWKKILSVRVLARVLKKIEIRNACGNFFVPSLCDTIHEKTLFLFSLFDRIGSMRSIETIQIVRPVHRGLFYSKISTVLFLRIYRMFAGANICDIQFDTTIVFQFISCFFKYVSSCRRHVHRRPLSVIFFLLFRFSVYY